MKKPGHQKYPSQLVVDVLRLIGYSISKACWFIRYEGRENIPPNDSPPFLIVSNHQTYVDPVWICLPMRRRIRYMAFAPAFGWPVLGKLIRYLGAFPVEESRSGHLAAMREAVRSLRDGAVLTIFPEGARQLADGLPMAFRTGAVRIARQASVPVLPVTISGGNRIWPQKQKYPHIFRRVIVTYHPLIEVQRISEDPREDLDTWTAKLKALTAKCER